MDQGAAQAQLLLHAPGELLHPALREGPQPGGLQQVAHAPLAAAGRGAVEAGEELQVLPHGEGRIEVAAQALGHEGDAPTHPPAVAGVGHVASQHLDAARLQAPGAGDKPQQGGLAHPVGPHEPHQAAGGHLQVDGLQGVPGAVAVGDPLDEQGPAGGHRNRSAGMRRFNHSGQARDGLSFT